MAQRDARQGTILILALWALGLLTVLAVNIGIQVRQRIELVSRLERRADLSMMAAAGIEKARAVIFREPEAGEKPLTPAEQQLRWSDNPAAFGGIPFAAGTVDVRYDDYDPVHDQWVTRYGLVDEDRKINVNRAGREILARLAAVVLGLDDDAADDLGTAIYDWREYGESEIEGFFSDEYYDQLEFPYPEKKLPYETIAELRMVKGMTAAVYDRLEPYLTVYGSGQVNLNTAPAPVLAALGFSSGWIDGVLSLRRGPDGIAMSTDDVIFDSPGALLANLGSFGTGEPEDSAVFAALSAQGLLGAQSMFYRVESVARVRNAAEERRVVGIFSGQDGRLVYWQE